MDLSVNFDDVKWTASGGNTEPSIPGIGHNRPDKAPWPETTILVCDRIPVKRILHLIPDHWLARFKNRNEMPKIKECCRASEDHDIEAFKSRPEEKALDIYIFHCNTCAGIHRVFCDVGDHKVLRVIECRWSRP